MFTRDGSKSFFASPSQVTSHFLASPSQVTSHFLASPSQVTSHLVQTQVKSQVSLSKYKSSRTFCPAVIRNQGQAGADPGFFAGGGGVNDGCVQRAPTGGLGLINIRLRYIASIEYSERFLFSFFLL